VRLLQIRHGQTPNNVVGALDTAVPGAGLTGLGRAQAQAVPTQLRHEPITAIYATALTRTQLTAGPLARARDLPVQVRMGLEEVPAGGYEMRSDEEAVHGYAATLFAWMSGRLDVATPGGQDGHTFLARYAAAVRSIAERHGPDETVAVVGHGAAIRVFTAVATGMDPDRATELRISNTGLGVLEGDPDAGWRLVRWHGEPLGGTGLRDEDAHDVTGESAAEEAEEHG